MDDFSKQLVSWRIWHGKKSDDASAAAQHPCSGKRGSAWHLRRACNSQHIAGFIFVARSSQGRKVQRSRIEEQGFFFGFFNEFFRQSEINAGQISDHIPSFFKEESYLWQA